MDSGQGIACTNIGIKGIFCFDSCPLGIRFSSEKQGPTDNTQGGVVVLWLTFLGHQLSLKKGQLRKKEGLSDTVGKNA